MLKTILLLILFNNLVQAKINSVLMCNNETSVLEEATNTLVSGRPLKSPSLNFKLSSMNNESTLEAKDLINYIIIQHCLKICCRIESLVSIRHSKTKWFFTIIFIDNYESFLQVFKIFNPESYDYQGYFLIIMMERTADYLLDIKKILLDFWSIHIVNVNILVKSSNVNEAELFTYFPYAETHCSEVHPIIWKTFKNGHFDNSQNSFFPNKIANLHKCPLKVVTFNSNYMKVSRDLSGNYATNGFDGKLLQAIIKKINFKLDLIYMSEDSSKWGNVYPNGSSYGALKYVSFTQLTHICYVYFKSIYSTGYGW